LILKVKKKEKIIIKEENKDDCKIYLRQMGSINSDSNFLIQFDPHKSLASNVVVPFQLQIYYTRTEDGKRLMRVISREFYTQTNVHESDKTADLEVIALHALRQVAQTAQNGNYTKARLQNYAHLQLMKRLTKASLNPEEAKDVLKNYSKHNLKFEEKMYREQLNEYYKGNKWDDTEEEMKIIAGSIPEKEEGIIPNFFVWGHVAF